MKEHFKKQIEDGATDMFFYAMEDNDGNLKIDRHRGTIDTIPTMEYLRHLTDGIPLFKQIR